ncbi:ATP-sensitive inward rectifier potassium channel 11-like isoform X1 [Pomacea canaliculata]|uniref:ATP-sensitive inward rectifier potassium channel 11-like isoform X1 n=1 Tax=Pomacea canaliculata TaxID=400727 RepID=UPI000D72D41B|nr:ATP-sensitive inward rectifier potassium channel 11-like isoform X1 [Pomacea canaliculata]
MANKDNPGYKVEELTPQNSAFTSRGQPRRSLLEKEGNSNLSFRGIERKPLMYLKDLYVTLVDLKWRYVLVILLTVYLLSYLVFAVFYWLLSYMNGQFGSRASEPGYEPCIKNLDSFAGAFLFSMETQSTIGFGHLNPNAACPGVVPVIYFQITVGFMVETFILGFLFVKRLPVSGGRRLLLATPRGRLAPHAPGGRNGARLACAQARGVRAARVPAFPAPHDVHGPRDGGQGVSNMAADPLSPHHRGLSLWTLRPEDVYREKVDIIVILEGIIESTGELCQARTCYSARDILWGHRFVRVEEFDEIEHVWCVDFTRFNNVLPSPTPRKSARAYHDQRQIR